MRTIRSFAMAMLCAAFAAAQEQLVVEGPDPSTIRLGDSARVTIRIEGREANPRTPKLPDVDGMRLQLTPPTRSSYTLFQNGRLTESVGVQYVLLLQPQREGTFTIPPFAIWTGTKEQQTKELRLDVRKDLRGDQLAWLDVQVEPQRVYVHEPIRIRVAFGIQSGVRVVQERLSNGQPYYDAEVQAPWLLEFPGGEPIEQGRPDGDLCIVVLQRTPVYAVRDQDHERNGDRWTRYVFERSFLPTRLGKIELSAPMLRYQRLVREGQTDIFGGRRGQQSENFFVYGKPISIEVLPIPEAGRPTPYYGAVGRFTIDASLDKDTVRVGSSVKLTLTVHGDGNLEFLRLPALDELEGFHKLGQAEAQRDADKVVVTYDLTPLSTDVRAVPPIAWNWFDTTPGVEKFVETTTRAIPLVVQPLANGETLAPLPDAAAKAITPGVDDIFDLPALDGPPVRTASPASWTRWAAVVLPWLAAVALSSVLASVRRRRSDPAAMRARAAGRTAAAALQRGAEPMGVLADYLGDRLGLPGAALIAPDLRERLVDAKVESALAADVVALIERGTAARYGGGAGLTVADVQALLQRLEGARFGITTLLPFVLWPLLAFASLATPADAQGPLAEAEAAYRAQDYRRAEAAFAQQFAATGDRRLWQARGNCFFRMGDLPRALWAFESARLGTPRDPELLANVRLVRSRLEVDDAASGFVAELATLRDRLAPGERLLLCAACMALAAGCLVLGWRRAGLRWVGALALVPGLALAVDLVWIEPSRPPLAIALQKLAIVSEPRAGLEPVATVRPGVGVAVLGGASGSFVRVAAGDRSGYVPRDAVALVE